MSIIDLFATSDWNTAYKYLLVGNMWLLFKFNLSSLKFTISTVSSYPVHTVGLHLDSKSTVLKALQLLHQHLSKPVMHIKSRHGRLSDWLGLVFIIIIKEHKSIHYLLLPRPTHPLLYDVGPTYNFSQPMTYERLFINTTAKVQLTLRAEINMLTSRVSQKDDTLNGVKSENKEWRTCPQTEHMKKTFKLKMKDFVIYLKKVWCSTAVFQSRLAILWLANLNPIVLSNCSNYSTIEFVIPSTMDSASFDNH